MDFHSFAANELTAVADKLADTAKKQLDAATAQLTATFQATIDRLRDNHADLVNENERLTAENAALRWEKEDMLERARRSGRAALFDRIEAAVAQLAAAHTVEDILTATADGLANEFRRVAAFRGDACLARFGEPVDRGTPSAMAFPLAIDGECGGTICAADETYADGQGPRLAALLCGCAGLSLERLTRELKTVRELHAYARMLIDEVEYAFNADARVAPQTQRDHLARNLRSARQIYGQRATTDGPAAAAVLDEVLQDVLARKADTPFGRELAELATAPGAPA
jgi:regulator of replication initiation timing